MLLSLAALQPAQAQGSYSSPIYTGGSVLFFGTPTPYTANNSGWGGGGSTGSSCGGQIQAQFVWNGSPGTAPKQVTIKETSFASWAAYGTAGKCDDGFQDPPGPNSPPPSPPGMGATSQATYYVTVATDGNGNVEVQCTPTASTPQGSGVSTLVSFSASIAPFTTIISIPAAVQDNSKNLHILIGQQSQPSLTIGPTGYSVSNLQWKASGNTVQSTSWTIAAGNNSATFSGLVNPYTYTQATQQAAGPVWYWDDSTSSQNVTCQVTVTPPVGQGAPITITARQNITLDSPAYAPPGSSVGAVELDANYLAYPRQISLHAGADSDNVPGILFQDTVTTPNLSLYGGTGYWYRIQLVSVKRNEYAMGSTTPIGAPGNSVINALDFTPLNNNGIGVVYNSQIIQANGSTFDPNHNTMAENDSPGFLVLDTYQEYQVANEQYTDYIMYHAPGTSVDVPLCSYNWSWNADVHIPLKPLPKSWINYITTPAGTPMLVPGAKITPPGSETRQLNYPVWPALNNPNLP